MSRVGEGPVGGVLAWLQRWGIRAFFLVTVVTTGVWLIWAVARAVEGTFFPAIELLIVIGIAAVLLVLGYLAGRSGHSMSDD